MEYKILEQNGSNYKILVNEEIHFISCNNKLELEEILISLKDGNLSTLESDKMYDELFLANLKFEQNIKNGCITKSYNHYNCNDLDIQKLTGAYDLAVRFNRNEITIRDYNNKYFKISPENLLTDIYDIKLYVEENLMKLWIEKDTIRQKYN